MSSSCDNSHVYSGNYSVLVHASNVTGLGASQVVRSLIMAFEQQGYRFDYIVPENTSWYEGVGIEANRITRFERFLPRGVSRILECLFAGRAFRHYRNILVLGDIPLRKVPGQVVLVHQPNLISPEVNSFSSRSLSFRVMRSLFGTLIGDVDCFVVQSEAMRTQLSDSYPAMKDKVVVIPQPAPAWLHPIDIMHRVDFEHGLRLFYPAAGYPHKNQALFMSVGADCPFFKYIDEFIVTLGESEIVWKDVPEKVVNIGRVSPEHCLKMYSQTDALFYPSLAESYGLPLVEAMILGLPIVCADLSYARWMCEDEAIYFDPQDIESATTALCELKKRLSSGWRPDWSSALSKLPKDWQEVSRQFTELLEC